MFLCVPPQPLPFLSSYEAQTRVELQPLTSGLKSPADCLSLSLILTTAPRKESSNDRNEDEWCSERLTGGFLKLVREKRAKRSFFFLKF